MELFLDINSDLPLYQQIRNQVILGLAEGELRNHETLPSTRQLAADFGINFHTVNKAYDMLRQEGILSVNRKTGAVVAIQSPPDFRGRWRESARIWLAEAVVKGLGKDEILAECEALMSAFCQPEPE